MGKSYNRNQDKHNKWDRERRERDHKKNKFKNNGQKNNLTSDVKRSSLSVEDGVSEY
jgi:hypothetical protein